MYIKRQYNICRYFRYIRLQYHPYTNLSDLSKKFKEESTKSNPHQFIEGILFNKNEGVVMLGDMVEEVGKDGRVSEPKYNLYY